MRGVVMKDSAAPASLAAEAYDFVKHRILRGELPMGQVISRRKIAAELGMSFLPVSEALLRLEFEGLLESRPRAGTRVRIPSPDDVNGHYVVREALEKTQALASIWFCVRRKPRPADSPTRHQDFVEDLLAGDPARAADAVR